MADAVDGNGNDHAPLEVLEALETTSDLRQRALLLALAGRVIAGRPTGGVLARFDRCAHGHGGLCAGRGTVRLVLLNTLSYILCAV